jgi:hypothetical protein
VAALAVVSELTLVRIGVAGEATICARIGKASALAKRVRLEEKFSYEAAQGGQF